MSEQISEETVDEVVTNLVHQNSELMHENSDLVDLNHDLLEQNQQLVEENKELIEQNEKLIGQNKVIFRLAGPLVIVVRSLWTAVSWLFKLV